MSSLPAILSRLDPQFQLAFEARRPNRTEAVSGTVRRGLRAVLERHDPSRLAPNAERTP